MKQKLLTGKIFLFLVALLTSSAWAAEPKYRFSIEPQSLRTAVPQFAEQAGGLNFFLLDGPQAQQIQVNRVVGEMTRREALQKMLASTGVKYRMRRPNAIVFRMPPPPPPPDQLVPPGLRTPEIVIAASRDRGRATGADPRYGDVRDINPDLLSIVSLADALRDPLLTGVGTQRAGELGSIAGNQEELNLYGLGTTDTTVLLNGRPMAGVWLGGAPMQPKLGAIPAAAIEDFKIVTGSASSIYGGGAGGTVDVVFRRDFEGLQLGATVGGVHGRDASASVSYGHRFFEDRTGVTLDIGVARESTLLMGDRDGLIKGRERIFQNYPDYWSARGVPPLAKLPNVSSANGSDLGGGLGPVVRLPEGYRTDPSQLNALRGFDFSIADTAQNEGGRAVLQSGMEGVSFIAQADHQLTNRHSLFIELLGTSMQSRTPANAAGFLGLEGVYVPASASTNPFGQDVRVTRPIEGADGILDERNEAWRGTLGASWKPSEWWSLDAEYSRSQSRLRWSQLAAQSAAADAADGVLNVFQDPALGPLDVSRYLYTVGTSWLPSQSEISVLTGTGPLIQGREDYATLTLAATHRADRYGSATVWQDYGTHQEQEEYARQSQETWSAFAELKAKYRQFELQIAGRWDQTQMKVRAPRAPLGTDGILPPAEPEFTSFSPRATLRWNAPRHFSLRASVGRGYVTPTVTQLAPAPVFSAPPGMFSDPQRGYESVTGATVRFGGNPSLALEEAKSVSAGIVITPKPLPNYLFSIDHTRIRKRGDISSLAGFDLQALEDLDGGRVVRSAPLPGDPWGVGPVVGLDLSDANVSRVDVDLWQSEMRGLTKERSWGQLEWFARGTWQPRFSRQLTPDSPMVDEVGVGSASALRFSAFGRVKWRYKDWSLAWATRHADSYQVSRDPLIVLSQGGARVPAQTFHDVTFGWRSEKLEHGLESVDVRLSVANVFNQQPAFDASAAWSGYYSPYADPRLRHARLMFSFTF